MHSVLIKSRNTTDICQVWKTAYEQLKAHGERLNIHILDNICSYNMMNIFKEAQVEYQLVSPHIHQCNVAEPAIRTYTNQRIAKLYTFDPNSLPDNGASYCHN